MWGKETKPECCVDPEPLPENIECMKPEICQEMRHLQDRNREAFTQSQRLGDLALMKPRQRTTRFEDRCPCHFKKAIQIVRLEQLQPTRTEQLAYPKARYLLLFKERVRHLFTPERLINLNRMIRKSLFSVYSRLSNVQPPQERIPIRKWDRRDWAVHMKRIKRLAKPKVVKLPPKTPSKRMDLKEMKRYKMLAKPKKYIIIERAEWHLTPEHYRHKASERTNNLAKPVERDTSALYQELPIQIPPNVLRHKASKRIKDLAEPSARRTAQGGNADFKENPFGISPNALKTKASKRTQELAEPKEYENKHIREDPYAISKAALNCKPRPRTIELAKPKKR